MCWLFGSEDAETQVDPVEASPEVEAVTAPCPQWRVQLLDLDGQPISGKAYTLKSGAVSGTLDGSGYSQILDEPIMEGAASNGRSGYVMFPDLKILPDFDRLWNGYPNGSSLSTVQGIGGSIGNLFGPSLTAVANGQTPPNEFTNTCVVRTSAAFNAVGQDFIPFVGYRDLESSDGNEDRGYGIPRGDIAVPLYRAAGGQNWPNGRPFAYGARVTEFAPFMQHYFPDAPVITGTNSPEPFRNKRGVIFFSVSGWSDANGHFDMWDGIRFQIRYSEYFARSTTVTLWQHVVVGFKEIQRADGVCTAVYQMKEV